MRRLTTTRRFERDLKKARRRGKQLDKLWLVVERLLMDQPLEPKYKPHRLSGNWKPFWECHIEPDWLLVWHDPEGKLILVRTGTHSDLFE